MLTRILVSINWEFMHVQQSTCAMDVKSSVTTQVIVQFFKYHLGPPDRPNGTTGLPTHRIRSVSIWTIPVSRMMTLLAEIPSISLTKPDILKIVEVVINR